ncbi:MAG: adenosine-specific kinase [Candidatus Aenigmarchaeota archaeon]|nr:adenosine-specific kinase [Candidatus Aenigmarchaeota archaeon]MCX8190752.1 adenosine-specific kinase [Candidatus Aenigmarchaeota archaeon]MDW8160000.1 adenosine-specific kinase [Candidatus Aenigmarchaeota archaeon]
MVMELKIVNVKIPEGANIILGRSHFIKTVEDIHELLVNCVPNIKFGIAFNEASGKCLTRHSGNDEELEKEAIKVAQEIGAGHTFVIFIKNSYPINILPRLKDVPEVVEVLAATANPLQVIVVETEQGRGILGVVDGYSPKGIEDEKEIKERKEFLRKIGYKL